MTKNRNISDILDQASVFASSISVGNDTINVFANSTIVQVVNSTSTANLTPASLTLGTAFTGNSSGLYHTGLVNAATIQASATFTANATLVNCAAINLSGQINVGANSIVSNSVISSGGSLLSANVQINPQTGTSYTLQASDSGKIVTMNNGSAMTVTVPAGLPIGFRCQVLRLGAGTCTLSNTGQTGCTILSRTSAFAITAQYGSASVFQTATANTYIIDGLV